MWEDWSGELRRAGGPAAEHLGRRPVLASQNQTAKL